jgi:hypothetical protein
MKLRPWLLIGAAALGPPPLWGGPQPVHTNQQGKMQPPETQNVPISADRVGDTADPVGGPH